MKNSEQQDRLNSLNSLNSPGRPDSPASPGSPGSPDTDAVLQRAVGSLRDEPDLGWEQTSTRVRETLRRTTRRSRRLTASTTDLASSGGFGEDDRLEVSERVVLDALRRAVSGGAGVAPVAIVLLVEPDPVGRQRCAGARLDLVVGYGTAITPLTAHLRSVVASTLDDLLGPAERVVDLEVVDVEPDDPGL